MTTNFITRATRYLHDLTAARLLIAGGTLGQPAVGFAGLFAKTFGNCTLLAQHQPMSRRYAIIPPMGWKNYGWSATPGSATIHGGGIIATATGTATAKTVTNTGNAYARGALVEYLVTTPATTAVAGWRTTTAGPIVTPSGVGSIAGGLFRTRFGIATGAATATARLFTGLSTATGAPTDVDPSTLTNCVGFGWDDDDTNIQFMHNDGAGTCTKVDTGMPVPTADRTDLYEAWIYVPTNDPDSTKYSYLLIDLTDNTEFSGYADTNVPGAAQLLGPRGWASVGGTSSVIGFGTAGADIWVP